MERYICIHGHFYQPPRENPWLDAIELQDTAYPYHDWNERITAECYAPNMASRILDEKGRIVQLVNNYSKISFDFGPTLLSWMESNAPDVYQAILHADKESRKRFSGHGSALAQAYNHMILPLANRRDKYTQVIWGIRDFEHRFGRKPEGMWLPETAVDLETLEILSELGILFTILAPRQAKRVRPIAGESWEDVSGEKVDPTMAYILSLPSGRTINLFFYDGPRSRAIAFEGLLKKGETFAQKILEAFSEGRSRPQLIHLATDGETYGHHHRHGDMALAYALHYIESKNLARFTNYGEYLERNPASHEVEIAENTSWSCEHGLERWRSDCGCNTGRGPGWTQAWRAPLREALDWTRDTTAPKYEEKARHYLNDPWGARNDYIEVILDRSPANLDRFLDRHAVHPLTEADKVTVLLLLELQRHAMLMYTSCGWFFDEISGLETVQIIQYAGRTIQLAQDLFGDDTASRFLELLEMAGSNVVERGNGRRIYEEFIKPSIIDLVKLTAHYVLSCLFEEYPERAQVYCYTVEREGYQTSEAGKVKLIVGRAMVTSTITRESAHFSFGALYFGDHNVNSGVREFEGEKACQTMVDEVTDAFARADLPETIRLLDKHFKASTYSLKSLFRDKQRKILDLILQSTLAEVEAIYRQLYEHHTPLMRYLADLGIPLPRAFYTAAEFVLNSNLRQSFAAEELDLDRIETLLKEARIEGIPLDSATLEYELRKSMERTAGRLLALPSDLRLLKKLDTAACLIGSLPFEVNTWELQNVCYKILQTNYPEIRQKAEEGDEDAMEWVRHFIALAEKLSVRID